MSITRVRLAATLCRRNAAQQPNGDERQALLHFSYIDAQRPGVDGDAAVRSERAGSVPGSFAWHRAASR